MSVRLSVSAMLVLLADPTSAAACSSNSTQVACAENLFASGAPKRTIWSDVGANRFGDMAIWGDGRFSAQIGDLTLFSDGTSSRRLGNVTIFNNGRFCTDYGHAVICDQPRPTSRRDRGW